MANPFGESLYCISVAAPGKSAPGLPRWIGFTAVEASIVDDTHLGPVDTFEVLKHDRRVAHHHGDERVGVNLPVGNVQQALDAYGVEPFGEASVFVQGEPVDEKPGVARDKGR